MRPTNIKSRIFLDGGNPEETREVIHLLGFLDGQTTNPTLISKNPQARVRLEQGGRFSKDEVYDFYRKVVGEISGLIPQGSVSVEVYADASTKADTMLQQGREMFSWIPNAHIKFPTTREGLTAAEQAVREGLRVNMTLCFSQEQAAAVYAATSGSRKGDIFVSPFIGRLDDRGENGMDLISHVLTMYSKGDGHVEVLTASVRNIEHLFYALKLGSDIITVPFKILKEWAGMGLPFPGTHYVYNAAGLKAIPYREVSLTKGWKEYDLRHELTDKGIDLFSKDWNSLIA
jgi:transaldolase